MTTAIMLLALHTMSTWFMTGLIWFVQVIHYPLFFYVGREEYVYYHRAHMQRTTWLVVPVMLIELLSAILLISIRPPFVSSVLVVTGLILLTSIWAITFLLLLPQHNRLEEGYNEKTNHRLVNINWLRTILWSARAVLTGTMMILTFQGYQAM